MKNAPIGKVFLVGAGPGDPRLITLRGIQCLQRADCVLFDGLVDLSLLDFAPYAEKISVGKHGKTPIWQQATINQEMIQHALKGKTVVRLKGGDPAVFARTAEELEALEAQRIPYEVVPGITAALAVGGYAGIPLTHRDHASAVALVTGQQSDEAPLDLDWQLLAQFPGTLSVYMGVTTSQFWSAELIAAGKPADTPATIVRRCSWGDQQVVYCRLDEVANRLTPYSKMRPPVLVVIGSVAHLGKSWNWFQRQPLYGCGIWIPRAAHQSDELLQELTDLGAKVVVQPVLRIEPPTDQAELFEALRLLEQHAIHGITFSSVNGVDGFLQFLLSQDRDARLLASVRLAAVGPATAQELRRYSLRADIVPAIDYSADGLIARLSDSARGEHWIVTTTNRSRPALSEGLQGLGAKVTECLCYQSVPVATAGLHLESALESEQLHVVLITSSFIAEMAHELLQGNVSQVHPIAISQQVAQTLSSLSWSPVAIAENNSSRSLVEAVLSYWEKTER